MRTNKDGEVLVAPDIFEGLEYVRASGETNMMDRNAVIKIAMREGYYEAANYVMENKDEYFHGFMHGFAPVEE